MKICVYAICRDEEQFVERFCESAKGADLIMIGDTGSTDGTIAKIVELAGRDKHIACFGMRIKPWRFDLARNATLALIPEDIDVCVSLDLDEVLQPGWREQIERVWEVGKTTRLRYLFDWGVGIAFKYEKIHARFGYKWHHPCHEYPRPYGIEEVWADTGDDYLMVVHKADNSKDRRGYFELLKLSIEEDPHCPHNAFYYARQLSFAEHWMESIVECNRYLALPKAIWPNERCYAHRVKGRCWAMLGNLAEAEKSFQAAAQEAPYTREPWFELALLMERQQRWPECYVYALRLLSITNREKVYTVDPEVWGWKPYLSACMGAWYIGLKDQAIKYAVEALVHDPTNKLLNDNLNLMKGLL